MFIFYESPTSTDPLHITGSDLSASTTDTRLLFMGYGISSLKPHTGSAIAMDHPERPPKLLPKIKVELDGSDEELEETRSFVRPSSQASVRKIPEVEDDDDLPLQNLRPQPRVQAVQVKIEPRKEEVAVKQEVSMQDLDAVVVTDMKNENSDEKARQLGLCIKAEKIEHDEKADLKLVEDVKDEKDDFKFEDDAEDDEDVQEADPAKLQGRLGELRERRNAMSSKITRHKKNEKKALKEIENKEQEIIRQTHKVEDLNEVRRSIVKTWQVAKSIKEDREKEKVDLEIQLQELKAQHEYDEEALKLSKQKVFYVEDKLQQMLGCTKKGIRSGEYTKKHKKPRLKASSAPPAAEKSEATVNGEDGRAGVCSKWLKHPSTPMASFESISPQTIEDTFLVLSDPHVSDLDFGPFVDSLFEKEQERDSLSPSAQPTRRIQANAGDFSRKRKGSEEIGA